MYCRERFSQYNTVQLISCLVEKDLSLYMSTILLIRCFAEQGCSLYSTSQIWSVVLQSKIVHGTVLVQYYLLISCFAENDCSLYNTALIWSAVLESKNAHFILHCWSDVLQSKIARCKVLHCTVDHFYCRASLFAIRSALLISCVSQQGCSLVSAALIWSAMLQIKVVYCTAPHWFN